MRSDCGHAVHVATLAAGETFGVVSALRGTPRTTTVEAVTPVRLRTLSGETLEYLASALPSFSGMLNDWVAQHDYRRRDGSRHHRAGRRRRARLPATDRRRVDDPVDAPFAEDGRFVKGRRRSRVRFIQQVDEMDCGAACLAMVARAFGRRVSLARIRQLVNGGLDGASLRSICRAGEELGLATRSVRTSARHLDQMPLPAIVHWDEHHWIVLVAVGREPRPGRRSGRGPPAIDTRGVRPQVERLRRALRLHAGARAGFPGRRAGWHGCGRWSGRTRHSSWRRSASPWSSACCRWCCPCFTQVIVDRVLVDQDLSLLHLMIVAMGATMCFIVLSLVLQRYLLSFSAVRIDAAALDFLTQRLLALPMLYFASRRTGDLQRRLEGIRQVRDFLVQHGIAGNHGHRPTGCNGGADGALQPVADARVSGHVSALRAADDRRGAGAAAGVPRSRGLVQQVPLLADRCDQGHRNGKGPRRANRRSVACCSISSSACRGRSSRPTSRR